MSIENNFQKSFGLKFSFLTLKIFFFLSNFMLDNEEKWIKVFDCNRSLKMSHFSHEVKIKVLLN